jgi:glycosyltransferase involved in cell wall biosynthesis
MRVLYLHNRYRAAGGEERVVAEETALLRRAGHEVWILQRDSAGCSRAAAAAALLSGGERPGQVAALVRGRGIDVVHAHNLLPRFGFRALEAAREAGARTVLHVHNFRFYCAVGTAFRDGAPCHECRGRNTLPGLRHMCRGSLPEAAAYAVALASQQQRLLGSADRLALLSRGHAELLRVHGLPEIPPARVLPNFIPDPLWAQRSRAHEGGYALCAGRLVAEKGFDTAIRAARSARVPLVVAGAGPDQERLRELAGGGEVRFTGWLSPARLTELRAGAAVSLAPSRCEEACPYSVLESVAAGVPVLGSDRGGLPELLQPGAALPAQRPEAFAEALHSLWHDPEGRRSLGEAALAEGRRRFSEQSHLEGLLELYRG